MRTSTRLLAILAAVAGLALFGVALAVTFRSVDVAAGKDKQISQLQAELEILNHRLGTIEGKLDDANSEILRLGGDVVSVPTPSTGGSAGRPRTSTTTAPTTRPPSAPPTSTCITTPLLSTAICRTS